MKNIDSTNLNTTLPKEQKGFFEISSKKDQTIFFDHVFKVEKPSKELKSAFEAYKKLL